MIKHQYNTPSKYEFAFINQAGETVYTLWLSKKAINAAIRLACENLARICEVTKTDDGGWEFNRENKTIFNTRAGITGKYTGRTLFEVNGTYSR